MKFLNGQIQLDSSLTGTTALFTSGLTVGSGQTSSSGIARGQLLNSNLTASANNDVLVGLDINPAFTNGAFSGLTNFGLRAYGYSNFQSGVHIFPANSVWSGGRPIQGALLTFEGAAVNYYAGYSSGSGFFHKFWTNATERVRIADGYTSIVSGNLLVGTATDAGYKLDVNGTARLNSTTLIEGPLTVNFGGVIGGTSIVANGNTIHNGGRGIYATGYAYGIQANQTMVGNWSSQPDAAGVHGTGQIGVYGSGGIAGFSGPSAFFTSLQGDSRVSARNHTSTVQVRGSGNTSSSIALIVENLSGGTILVANNAGNVLIGTTTDLGFKLSVSGSTLLRGSGTTSGTTAILIQSSTGGTGSVISNTGNYGINVDIPLANFHTRGLYNELYFQSPTTNSGRHDISFGFGGTGRQVRIMTEAAGGGGQGNLYIVAGSGDVAVATTSDANLVISTTATTLKKNVTIDNNVAGLTNPGLVISGYQVAAVTSGIYFRYSETRVAILSKPTGGGGNADFRIATVPTIGGSGNNPPQESDTKFMITHDTANTLINTTTDLGFKLSVSGSTLLRGSGTTSASYALATQNSSGGTTMVVNNAGNMLIGTTTDAGFKLEVNGSTRVKGNSLTISASGLSSVPANYVALNFDDSPNHHEQWFAIRSKKDIQGVSTGYDRIIFPTMGSDNSTWDFKALGNYSAINISATASGATLNLNNTSIIFNTNFKVATMDSTNRKLFIGNMSTDVHHLSVYDLVIKGAQPFEGNANVPNGGNVYIVGGTPSTSPVGNYGNVILAHDGTSARGSVLIGTITNNNSRLLIGGTVSGATLSTTRATHINATLLATGNTTTLIGLDIQPTFTPGSFTGLTQLALRVSGGTQIIGSGSTGTTLSVFSVDGSSGRLFDVSDDLSSTLFSVNTIAGLPVIEAFANSSVVLGKYGQNTLVVSGTSVGIGTPSPQAKLDVNGTSIFRTGVTMNSSLTLGNVDITSPWSAYTPTWTTDGGTQPALNNGTLTGFFKLIGKICFVRVKLNPGSTTTFGSGAFQFSLPFSASSPDGIQFPCSILNNGFAWYQATVNGTYSGDVNKSAIIALSSGGVNSSEAVTATHPITFGVSDSLQFNGSYEIA
jgi:hypothetical protein